MRKGSRGRKRGGGGRERSGRCRCYSFYSKTIVSAHRLDPLRRLATTEIPLIALDAEPSRRVARARRNYARRPSRDGDNSLFRLRSLIERPPSLLPSSSSLVPPFPGLPDHPVFQRPLRLFRLICAA